MDSKESTGSSCIHEKGSDMGLIGDKYKGDGADQGEMF